MLTHSWSPSLTVVLLSGLALGSALAGSGQPATSHPRGTATGEEMEAAYGRLPLCFEANRGQTDVQVHFLSRGPGYTLFLTDTEAVLALQPRRRPASARRRHGGKRPRAATATQPPTVLRMKLEGARPRAQVTGAEPLPGRVHYFTGRDPQQWRTDIPTYGRVRYSGVYPGVDLVYYGNQRELEYDFVVAPGADPGQIRLSFAGAEKLEVEPGGDLVLHTPDGKVRQRKPCLYQEVAGVRREVAGRYLLLPAGTAASADNHVPEAATRESQPNVGFEVAQYDAGRPLVIDPVLSYSTFLGGTTLDKGEGIAVDRAGRAYMTGATNSVDFPATPGAFDPGYNAGSEVFVSKLNTAGSTLLYSTYLGGSASEEGLEIAVDFTGRAYVTGFTGSADFPTTPGAFDQSLNGLNDAFVAKLNANGSALLYSTYLGGSVADEGRGIAVDRSGNAYLTGFTGSVDFPTTTGAFDTSLTGITDGFVARLNATGSALVYSTYLGGTDSSLVGELTEAGTSIALDGNEQAFVTGFTRSPDFPVTPGAFATSLNGSEQDAFVTKLNATGTALVYSTFLGGPFFDQGFGIAVDPLGHAYVTGWASAAFPTTPGAFDAVYNGGSNDAFVTKLNFAGTALVYSTYVGSSGSELGLAIAVDRLGRAHMTGWTDSENFPTTPNAVDPSFNGDHSDAYVTSLNANGSALLHSSFFGGNNNEEGLAIAVDHVRGIYVTGRTNSSDFPTTGNAFDTTFNGVTDPMIQGEPDAFVLKLRDTPHNGKR